MMADFAPYDEPRLAELFIAGGAGSGTFELAKGTYARRVEGFLVGAGIMHGR